jgi:hypothetical protein
MLAQEIACNRLTAEELFADSVRSFLAGAVPDVPLDAPVPGFLLVREAPEPLPR